MLFMYVCWFFLCELMSPAWLSSSKSVTVVCLVTGAWLSVVITQICRRFAGWHSDITESHLTSICWFFFPPLFLHYTFFVGFYIIHIVVEWLYHDITAIKSNTRWSDCVVNNPAMIPTTCPLSCYRSVYFRIKYFLFWVQTCAESVHAVEYRKIQWLHPQYAPYWCPSVRGVIVLASKLTVMSAT